MPSFTHMPSESSAAGGLESLGPQQFSSMVVSGLLLFLRQLASPRWFEWEEILSHLAVFVVILIGDRMLLASHG